MGERLIFRRKFAGFFSLLVTLTFDVEVRCKSIDFYVLMPDELGVKYTEADIVLNEPFKMICRYSDPDVENTCEQLWIYGESSMPLVRMFNDGTGSITDNFARAAKGHMNATFEKVKTGMRVELDVYQATQKLFSHPAYSCRCVNWHEQVKTVQLLIHEQTSPKDLVLTQTPSSPYLEGQRVTFSCSAEAWPSKTQFQILANQKQVFCSQQVAKSRDGVRCEVDIEYALHQQMGCQATNKMGTHSKQYQMTIYVKARYFKSYDVQSKLGQEATLTWEFSMFPLPEETSLLVTKDDVIIKHSLPPYKAMLTRLNDTSASFELKVPVRSTNDYGIYNLTVENAAGLSSQEILLNYTVRPLLPLSIEFQPVSPEEALLVWHIGPESYGGIPEYFHIKFWNLKSLDPEPEEFTVEAVPEQPDYSQRLKDLEALGSYQSQLRSCNGMDLCSPWSPQIPLNLSDPKFFMARQSGGETTEASAVLVAFFIVIGVCTLLLVAAAIFIAKRKHNERKSRKERIAARNADGYATIPSRTVMRIPPPSPGTARQFNTLDWSNTYRPMLEFQNFHHPAQTLPKDFSDAGIQTQQDPDLLEHISKMSNGSMQPIKAGKQKAKNDSFVTFNGDEDLTPPLAVEDEELNDVIPPNTSSQYGRGLYNSQRIAPPLPQRISRTTGNI